MSYKVKRNRGRPKKRVPRVMRPDCTFRALPPGDPTERDVTKLITSFREFLQGYQFMETTRNAGSLTALADALAAAIRAGDAYRVAYYSRKAMINLSHAVLYEQREVAGKQYLVLDILSKGLNALHADANRASTQKIRRG